MLRLPLLLCGLLAASSVSGIKYRLSQPSGVLSPSPDYSVSGSSMKGRLSDVIFSLAGLSSSVSQLEVTSRELQRSAEETAGDDRASRLANHMIDQQTKHKAKLQELTHNVSEKLMALKTRLADVSVQVQKLRDAASDADSQGNPIERIVRFFSAFEQNPDPNLRLLPLAILYKANYTIFDMLPLDAIEKNMDKLLSLTISDPKL